MKSSDLRGAVRLATDATRGLTDLVEAVHGGIAQVPSFSPPSTDGRTGGISGLVYRSVRGVTRVVGGSIDALLGLLAPALAADDGSPERAAVIAALNGVLGDHLAATANPLATAMSLRLAGAAPGPDWPAGAVAAPQVGPRLLVLVHGLCMNDLQWRRDGHDHGAALAHDLGFTPLYLRYSSGLHVSTNGRELATQLESLLERWPVPIERVVLLCHSMGGLVARSALHQAQRSGLRWPGRVDDLVFLGTPHHGAPLERAGNLVGTVLGATPYAAPFARLARLRSAGITDLRHGHLLDGDESGQDRFAPGPDHRTPVPLPESVRCFAVAACLAGERAGTVKRLLGDGLVGVDSALGGHTDPARCLQFASGRTRLLFDTGHMRLLSHPEVYAQLLRWLG